MSVPLAKLRPRHHSRRTLRGGPFRLKWVHLRGAVAYAFYGTTARRARGPDGTIRIRRVAEEILPHLGADSARALAASAEGINCWLDRLPAGLPVEFALLDYAPEPWRPADSIAVQRRWWWYLTGRLHVLYT